MADQTNEEPKVSTMENIKYKAVLYGTMGKLMAEVQYLNFQVKRKKQAMGLTIYDRMAGGDHKGAEEQFMTTKKDVDEKMHTLKLKRDELEQLKTDGQSESVTKPGSKNPLVE